MSSENLLLFSGSANQPLTQGIARALHISPGERDIQRFPDGELRIELGESVRGQDVYLLQPTCAPVAENLLELLLLADAARRAGAAHLTAVIPYFGYARQDRRASGREPVSARVVADLLAVVGFDRVVGVDAHTGALEATFSNTIPFEHLSAAPLLAEAARPHVAANSVVVAPDLGATKLAELYATALRLPVAIVHKARLTAEEVSVRAITGEVRHRAPLLVDDMISTGGTIAAAAAALLEAGCLPEITVVASHSLLVGQALERLSANLSIQRLITTDSVPLPSTTPFTLHVVGLAGLLADAIDRLHTNRSLDPLLHHA
jgi:ribose-phosphate pyrophosphokinase